MGQEKKGEGVRTGIARAGRKKRRKGREKRGRDRKKENELKWWRGEE